MRVESHGLQSKFMRREVEWVVAVPPGGAKAVIMCLHGRNGSQSFAFESIGVH